MLVDHIGIPQLRDMAKRSEKVSGDVDIAGLTRLAETLFSEDNQKNSHIAAQFAVGSSMQGFPEISGTLSGKLALQCQRCLGLLEWPLELDFKLAVVESDEDTEDFAEPFDTVIAGEHGIRLADIVEDEVLSSLPLAPVHAHSHDWECRAYGPAFASDTL